MFITQSDISLINDRISTAYYINILYRQECIKGHKIKISYMFVMFIRK